MRRKQLLAAVAVALLASPALAQDKIKLRYGQIANSARSVSSLALNIAQRKGFLARENIELESSDCAASSTRSRSSTKAPWT